MICQHRELAGSIRPILPIAPFLKCSTTMKSISMPQFVFAVASRGKRKYVLRYVMPLIGRFSKAANSERPTAVRGGTGKGSVITTPVLFSSSDEKYRGNLRNSNDATDRFWTE